MLEGYEKGVGALEGAGFKCFIPNISVYIHETIMFKKGSSLKKYINRAGGISAFANNRDVVVIHPSGTAIPKSRWSSPKVIEGSTIIVYQRALSGSSKGPTGSQMFTMVSSQTANVATTLLTLMLLLNQTSPN